ncbi:hypothetical protein [Fluviicola taffensis]|uniref:Uncharacterized protein n=1 Tax=Fluviicola taffensis (strain DSM 16823 / NCIMB 13979 / RW262) TaxID=755732 RepID=F2IBQ4_FLUTR|nr:hypothetical protein [Fluviicola taffensis]AEA45380.1 hypothetical protein Fluta_3408 [Fluviicola taffensis DSM 16823]
MSKFDFKSIHRELPEQLLQKTVIWIWNADKIPPHIGISVGKDYFSLTYRKSEQLLTTSMLKKAKRSAIPLVLVEIPKEIVPLNPQIVFSSYEKAIDGITCLHPIREVMNLGNQVNQLSDLLVYLESKKLINQVNGLNLPENYTGIKAYSMDDILNRIDTLNE